MGRESGAAHKRGIGVAVRRRFWVEAASAWLSLALAVLTLLWRNWIEVAFGFDPDRGSGSAEWLIAAASAGATLLFAALARAERRHAQAAAAARSD